METIQTPDLRYPLGKFKAPVQYSDDLISEFIKDIEETPARLREAVKGLNEEQLNTPYRPGGWTIRQVIHHLPDSHMNSYVRFKWALTEDEPLIKTYEEQLWAELEDTKLTPVDVSLDMMDLLHKRWVILLRSLTQEQLERKFRHPQNGLVNLKWVIALYSWHGKHHVAHIISLRERNNW